MNSSFYFQSDTIIYFLNGTNVLDSDVTLSIQNATNVSFIGAAYNGFTGTPSMITCNSTSCLSYTNVSNLTIANLAITNFRTHPDATAITLVYVKDSTLDSILVLNIFGYGVQLQNSGGQSLTIINSMFVNISGASLSLVNNSAPTYIADSQFTDCFIGGMVLNTDLTLERCVFTRCKKACVNTIARVTRSYVTLIQCSFASSSTGLDADSYAVSLERSVFKRVGVAVQLKNCFSTINQSLFEQSTNAGVYIYSDVEIIESNFTTASSSIVIAVQSVIYLTQTIVFTAGYSAAYGGALYLSNSYVTLRAPTNVSFINNTAELGGGAIYNEYHHSQGDCFFRLVDANGTLENPGVHLYFKGNRANEAGGDVYASLQCTVYDDGLAPEYAAASNATEVFQAITSEAPIQLAADPFIVCIIFDNTDMQECANSRTAPYQVAIYPGQSKTLFFITLDEYGQITPSLVYFVDVADNRIVFIVRTEANASQEYDISSSLGSVVLELATQTVITSGLSLFDQYIYVAHVSVTVLPCPDGFILSINTSKCVCNSFFHEQGLSCDIGNNRFLKPLYSWIGHTSNGTNSAFSDLCPPDYCKASRDVNPANADEQCDNNHAGVLCGACALNFSSVFGATLCRPCEDSSNLWLLIIFAIMGVAVLVLLVTLNVTVNNGVLNGFLFYANVIKIYDSSYLPAQSTDTFVKIFSIFVSWLNLDLGIVTCFYKGMSEYDKSWLQFTFPIYIFILAGGVALLGSYSKTVSRLFSRRKMIPLLATLLLITYTKLLKVSIAILSFSEIKIESENGTSSKKVWKPDGNVDYLKDGHIPLFIAATLVLMAFVAPYTLLLLLTPCIKAKSDRRIFCWINKLKPFIDCYESPYETRHRFWTGVLLLSRIVIYVTNEMVGFNQPDANSVIVFVIAFGLTLYLTRFAVYKRWQYTLVEIFLYLNMAFFSVFSLVDAADIVASIDGSASLNSLHTAYSFAVGSTFLLFLIVMGLQVYIVLRGINASRKHVIVKETKVDSTEANTYVVLDVSHERSETEELSSMSDKVVRYT